jgi:ATP/ADP translocase/HEAT repeat protein
MRDAVLQALKIRPGETQKVMLMAAYLLLAVSTFITGRIARDSLFLSAFSKEQLAYMYISVAVMVPLPAYFYARIADRFRRDKMIVATLAIIIVGMLVCRLLLFTNQAWVYVVLYNFVEVFGTFLVLQFWTFAGDMFSSREAKRLFPFIGAGAVMASIVCGVSISQLVKRIGTENLLWLQMVMMAGCMVIVAYLGTKEKGRLQHTQVQTKRPGRQKTRFQVKNQVENVFASKHLKIIAGMTVATFITVPLIDYQFKVLAKEAYTSSGGHVDTDALSSFMGLFSALTGVIAAVMQLGLTGRILERFGVVVSLLLLPLTLLVGMGGMILGMANAFYCAVFTKGAENAFRYSIYDATMQVIYTPVPSSVRGRAKTFIDGIVKPIAGGFAGAAMVAIVGPLHLPITSLAFVAAGLTAAWLVLILFIRREYVSQLLATLRKRRLDFSEKTLVITDDPTVAVLRRTLKSENPAEVRNAVELARRVSGHDLTAEVVTLLQHKDSDLRVRALEILSRSSSIGASEQIHVLFTDEDDEVKAAAVRAFCAIVGEPALRVVKDMLASPAPAVRGAAVASLIKHGGLEGILLSAEHLKEMQTSPNEAVRYAAAHVLKDIGVKNFYQPVLALMRDASPRVQNAAVAAAGAMCSAELIPALVYKLGQRDTARAASQALAAYGEPVVDVLGKVLAQDREEPTLRRQVPRILERIGTARCLDVLMNNLAVRDPDTRRETARAAARLRDRLNARVDEHKIRQLADEEMREHYQNLAALEDLNPIAGHGGPDLLRDAIEERLARSLDRIFRLLSIVYPLKAIELIHANMRSNQATTKANAIEVLDNLLDPEEKRRVLPLLEDVHAGAHGRAKVVEHGAAIYKLERRAPQEWIELYLKGRDPWLVVVALHVTGELGLHRFAPLVAMHVKHADAIVRETALRTLAIVTPPAELLVTCGALDDDRDPVVRRTIEWIMREAARAVPSSVASTAAIEAPKVDSVPPSAEKVVA